MPDFSLVPVAALSAESKMLISTLLNPPKVLPGENGLLRDWRGFAHICSIGGEQLPAIVSDPNPFNLILTIVQKRSPEFTLETLKNALEKIGRWDIVDDSQHLLENDAESYLQRLANSQTSAGVTDYSKEAEILTLDDQFRIERGESTQHYDGFLLYDDEDYTFVTEIIENLEKINNLKLCLKDRDLIAGITFEHEAIMTLISERCNRLITIISPNFLKSSANEFFINFAQANGIDTNQKRKIIPIVYKPCEKLPQQLVYFSKIYYNEGKTPFFWDKLLVSMKTVRNTPNAKMLKEIPAKLENPVVQNNNEGAESETVVRDKEREDSPGESPKLEELTKLDNSTKSKESSKNQSKFSWFKTRKNNTKVVSALKEDSIVEESIPHLPSIDGVDPLASFTSTTPLTDSTHKSERKKKSVGSAMKNKAKALFVRS